MQVVLDANFLLFPLLSPFGQPVRRLTVVRGAVRVYMPAEFLRARQG